MKHPEIKVQLTGKNGNAFVLLGTVQSAMKKAKLPDSEIKEFISEATNGDYDHLLQTCMIWVEVS